MLIGLGDDQVMPNKVCINVYMANRPPMPPYDLLSDLQPMSGGEINAIGQHTGNHWRKVFNVYAKLMFEFMQTLQGRGMNTLAHFCEMLSEHKSWQHYRDHQLLQSQSGCRLLFGAPLLGSGDDIHIIMGKGYAQQLGFDYEPPYLVNHEHQDFALYREQRVILCPYFDYRQLSNIKISALVDIMLDLLANNVGKQQINLGKQ